MQSALRKTDDGKEFANEPVPTFGRREMFGSTGMKVTFQDLSLDMFNMPFHSQSDLQNPGTVRIVFQHLLQLRTQTIQALERSQGLLLVRGEH